MDIKKKNFINAYEKSIGNIYISCKACNINRCTYHRWMHDKEFAEAIKNTEPKEIFKDLIEHKLVKMINDEIPSVVIFSAKTQCKDRGYIERQEITGADGKDLMTWNITPVKSSDGNK